MTIPIYRDLSAERRSRAAACVERHRGELAAIMTSAGRSLTVVEGSAVAAEVFLADTNTLHTAVRIAVFFAPTELAAIERTLQRHGFERTDPTGDVTLLRLATRSGRRAIHVLFEGDGTAPVEGSSQDDGTPPRRLHPGDPAAARARAARLGTAWLDVATAFRRVHHRTGDDQEVTESFEVQLLPSPPARG